MNALCERLATLPYALEIEHSSGWVGVVHADVPLEISWSYYMHRLTLERRGDAPPIAIRAATWGRERIRTYTKDDAPLVHGIEHVISGHTTVNTPTWLGNVAYIDTGAFRSGGRLTVATLEELLDLKN